MAIDRLVLDASFALEAVAPTSRQWQEEAFDLLEKISGGEIEARVPWLFFAEVASIVTKRVRGRRMDAADAVEFLARIDALGLSVDLTLDGAGQIHANALAWNAGAYDSIYVDADRRMAVPIATRDRGMATAARAAGVEVL